MRAALGASPVGAPAPLSRYPEVVEALRSGGFGDLLPEGLASPAGRNTSWLGATSCGRQLFVKRLTGPRDSVDQRLARMRSFERHMATAGIDAFRSPRLLLTDTDSGTVVHDRVDGASSLLAGVLAGTVGEDAAYAVGRAAGQLHASTPLDGCWYDESLPDLPAVDDFDHLTLEQFYGSTWGQLEVVRMHQDDRALAQAVRGLRRAEQAAAKVPSHCDLRLDQVLVRDGQTWFLDWEEFRLADPARDVGSLAGEWIYRAIMNIVRQDAGSERIDVAFDHETVLQRGVARLTELRPHVHALWRGYVQESPHGTAATAVRAAGFVGWHMQDRLMADAQVRPTLPAIGRAAAGIGRMLLLRPADFAALIGLEGGRDVE